MMGNHLEHQAHPGQVEDHPDSHRGEPVQAGVGASQRLTRSFKIFKQILPKVSESLQL